MLCVKTITFLRTFIVNIYFVLTVNSVQGLVRHFCKDASGHKTVVSVAEPVYNSLWTPPSTQHFIPRFGGAIYLTKILWRIRKNLVQELRVYTKSRREGKKIHKSICEKQPRGIVRKLLVTLCYVSCVIKKIITKRKKEKKY